MPDAAPITVADFKARFRREWGYGPDAGSVEDADVQDAISDAQAFYVADMWPDSVVGKTAFLFLAAHLLNANIKAAGGLSSTITGAGLTDTGDAVVVSTGAGGVNVGYAVPEGAREDPVFSAFLTSRFGLRFVQMAWPLRKANVGVVAGFNDLGAPTGE